MLPDEPAIGKSFDYLVPDDLGDQVRIGDRVRVVLQGRRVGGWITDLDVTPPPGVPLREVAKLSGRGPTPDLIALARWAAWRWAGRPASFLRTASPERVVAKVPPKVRRPDLPPTVTDPLVRDAFATERSLVRLPPAVDPYPIVRTAAGLGAALVLCPTVQHARRVARRLTSDGVPVAMHPRDWAGGLAGATVVGTRGAAWAPVTDLAAVVVLDEHDESYQQEQAPTWHARDVALERAARAGVPCVMASPCPSLEALAAAPLLTASRVVERSGWPVVDVVDMQRADPHVGMLTPQLVRLLRSDLRVVCLLNRTGRARLLACVACRELARCERCDAAVAQPGEELVCMRCGESRPVVCLACGRTRLKAVRQGVTRVRDEIEALVGEPVDEVTSAKPVASGLTRRVVVGTEATLHQIERADVVAFLDFDQELLAPRYRAAEQAFALLARAARLVGGKAAAGGTPGDRRLVVQTSVPRHEVVQAALLGDPGRVAAAEAERREMLRFPPVTAMAEISGVAAPDLIAALGLPFGLEVLGPSDGHWLLRAEDHETLCNTLASVPRPAGRLRVAVDPLRI